MLLLALTLTFGSLTTEDAPRVTSQLRLIEAAQIAPNGFSVSHATSATHERGGVGWSVWGVIGGAPLGFATGAILGGLLGNDLVFRNADYDVQNRGTNALALGFGILHAVGAGIGGYLLGEAARNGSLGAKIGVVVLNLFGASALITTVGAVALMAAGPIYVPN